MKEYLTSKLHNIVVTGANVAYTGSIKIDEDLMDTVGLEEHQKVLVSSNSSGARLETYVIKGARGSGIVEMNGAAAHLIKTGERIIIMGFSFLEKAVAPKIFIAT